MEITKLYQDYFQKSKAFLYPVLGIRRTETINPINTYISWENHISKEDRTLIVLFDVQNTQGYRSFEKLILFKNPLFVDVIECENNQNAYIFTFDEYRDDWTAFLQGRYSKMSEKIKNGAKAYYGINTGEWAYMKSYFYPEQHYQQYARLLTDEKDTLRMIQQLIKIGELCNPYNVEREDLKVKVKELNSI